MSALDPKATRAPRMASGGVPMCSEDECPMYDGKRCREMGLRPGNLCEPAVADLAAEVERLRAPIFHSTEHVCGARGKSTVSVTKNPDRVTCVLCLRAMAHGAWDLAEKREAVAEQLRAEVEMLRGVGCEEDGDGPCGVCIKCLRKRAEAERALRLCTLRVAHHGEACGCDGCSEYGAAEEALVAAGGEP